MTNLESKQRVFKRCNFTKPGHYVEVSLEPATKDMPVFDLIRVRVKGNRELHAALTPQEAALLASLLNEALVWVFEGLVMGDGRDLEQYWRDYGYKNINYGWIKNLQKRYAKKRGGY